MKETREHDQTIVELWNYLKEDFFPTLVSALEDIERNINVPVEDEKKIRRKVISDALDYLHETVKENLSVDDETGWEVVRTLIENVTVKGWDAKTLQDELIEVLDEKEGMKLGNLLEKQVIKILRQVNGRSVATERQRRILRKQDIRSSWEELRNLANEKKNVLEELERKVEEWKGKTDELHQYLENEVIPTLRALIDAIASFTEETLTEDVLRTLEEL